MNFFNETAVYHSIARQTQAEEKRWDVKISTNMATGDKAEPFIYSFNFKGITDSDKNIHFSNSLSTWGKKSQLKQHPVLH